MDNFLDEYIKTNGSKSIRTRQTMSENINRIMKILKVDKFEQITVKKLKNIELFMDKLLEDYSLNTAISTLTGMLRLIEIEFKDNDLKEAYREILNELVEERVNAQNEQLTTPKEKENWIDYPELVEEYSLVAEEIIKRKKIAWSNIRNLMILGLFVLQPPARIGNYLNMRVKFIDDLKSKNLSSLNKNNNYIVIDENDDSVNLVYNKYKTAKTTGRKIYKVENQLLKKIILRYIEDWKAKKKNTKKFFLITNQGTEEMSQPAVSNALKKWSSKNLGNELSQNMLRHIFLTDFMNKPRTIKEKEAILERVGHNYKPSQAEKYVRAEHIVDFD